MFNLGFLTKFKQGSRLFESLNDTVNYSNFENSLRQGSVERLQIIKEEYKDQKENLLELYSIAMNIT